MFRYFIIIIAAALVSLGSCRSSKTAAVKECRSEALLSGSTVIDSASVQTEAHRTESGINVILDDVSMTIEETSSEGEVMATTLRIGHVAAAISRIEAIVTEGANSYHQCDSTERTYTETNLTKSEAKTASNCSWSYVFIVLAVVALTSWAAYKFIV